MFEGLPNPTKAEEWLQQVNKMFDAMSSTDDQMVKMATFILKGEANCW